MQRILIVDDDAAVTNYLMVFMMQTGRFEPTVLNDSRQAEDLLGRETFDIILLDMDMPNVSGMDILRLMNAKGITTPAIILTGVSDVDLAVRAMKLTAFDYLTKPVDDDHLLEVIDAALEHHAVHHSIEQLPTELKREDLTHRDAFAHIPTQNPSMIRLLHQAERVAASDLSVFIHGERGTGKEMLARAIHNASPARKGAFVIVDATALGPEQFAAAFFGQARLWGGAQEEQAGFLEEAEEGTIYLCEIEHIPLPVQVRLKRILQTGEYYRENSTRIRQCNVRFIVSSSVDLTSPAYQDRFSPDLLYHLMVNSLSVPPLRERLEDLPQLIAHFQKKGSSKIQKQIAGFADEYLTLLAKYDFPDNIQELRNIVESSMVNADHETVTIEALPPYIRQKIAAQGASRRLGFRPRPLHEVEREHVLHMYRFFGENRERVAQELEISCERLEEYLAASE